MGLPNFKCYCWASNIKMMTYWLQKNPPLWFSIENACYHPSSLPAMLFSALPTVDPDSLHNPVISHSLKIWSQIRKSYGWQSCSLHSLLIKNHVFAPCFTNTLFKNWFEKGIHTFLDIFIDQVFPTFEQIQENYNIPRSQFYKYLQIRSFVIQNNPSYPNSPNRSSMELILMQDPSKKAGISKIYESLSNLAGKATMDHLRLAWQDDLSREITEDQWQRAPTQTHSSSICARHSLMQFKIIHHLHWSKQKLHSIFPSADPLCDRCGLGPASIHPSIFFRFIRYRIAGAAV